MNRVTRVARSADDCRCTLCARAVTRTRQVAIADPVV